MSSKLPVSKRTYTVSIKASKDYQSVSLTEGFEVDVDDNFSEIDYENQKEMLKNKLTTETQNYLNEFVNKQSYEKMDLV